MLEAIFGFLTSYNPAIAVLIYSFLVTFLINIFYRILIKQEEAKALKARTNEINKEMRAEQKAGNKEKANQLMGEMMQSNSKLMRMTMKPMLVSFVIVIILLPFLHTAYGDRVTTLENNTGIVDLNSVNHTIMLVNNTLVLENAVPYESLTGPPGCDYHCFVAEGNRYEARVENNKAIVTPVVATLPLSLPFVGYNLGWLGWYIIISIPFVIVVRKLLKVYV